MEDVKILKYEDNTFLNTNNTKYLSTFFKFKKQTSVDILSILSLAKKHSLGWKFYFKGFSFYILFATILFIVLYQYKFTILLSIFMLLGYLLPLIIKEIQSDNTNNFIITYLLDSKLNLIQNKIKCEYKNKVIIATYVDSTGFSNNSTSQIHLNSSIKSNIKINDDSSYSKVQNTIFKTFGLNNQNKSQTKEVEMVAKPSKLIDYNSLKGSIDSNNLSKSKIPEIFDESLEPSTKKKNEARIFKTSIYHENCCLNNKLNLTEKDKTAFDRIVFFSLKYNLDYKKGFSVRYTVDVMSEIHLTAIEEEIFVKYNQYLKEFLKKKLYIIIISFLVFSAVETGLYFLSLKLMMNQIYYSKYEIKTESLYKKFNTNLLVNTDLKYSIFLINALIHSILWQIFFTYFQKYFYNKFLNETDVFKKNYFSKYGYYLYNLDNNEYCHYLFYVKNSDSITKPQESKTILETELETKINKNGFSYEYVEKLAVKLTKN